ncbi:MAG: hypothetical protein GY712_00130 [Oceanicoccus sp.]|uniref:hypothetical protein n=1 Tax=Oceanicoccus sp. TaxID=2691044 RepID=UPI00262DCF15|nr:hypothetical protein [Oceanicoccus sp.]MCP3906416.1 hypothetical protein [Oceanicoccus sp.]MDG1773665.1 hypothetical protein [Oceanicoccus sp.]
MSATAVVVAIGVGLFILVAVAITIQTIDRNNKEKRRLEIALNTRSRNFGYMLDGFPEGFLSRDLQVLVCTCLVEVFSQLVQINPTEDYKSKLASARERLAQCRGKTAANATITLTDVAQIQEIQKMLKGLYNFISKLAASQRISGKEAMIYGKQVRRLMVQTSTDALAGPIQEAIHQDKPRLAIHYLHMTNEKMKNENDDGFYSDRIAIHDARISELEQQASSLETSAKESKKEAAAAWDELDKPDDSWKKKAIYD